MSPGAVAVSRRLPTNQEDRIIFYFINKPEVAQLTLNEECKSTRMAMPWTAITLIILRKLACKEEVNVPLK